MPSPLLAQPIKCCRTRPSRAASTCEPVAGTAIRQHTRRRNYSSAVADIATVGADRYRGNQHFSVTLTAVHLSNVPGTAMSAGVAYTGISALRHPVICALGRERRRKHGLGANVAIYQNDFVFSKRPALVYSAHRFGLRRWMVSLDRRLRPFRVARCSSRTALASSSSSSSSASGSHC